MSVVSSARVEAAMVEMEYLERENEARRLKMQKEFELAQAEEKTLKTFMAKGHAKQEVKQQVKEERETYNREVHGIRQKNVTERNEIASEEKLCFKCPKGPHLASDCRSKISCSECGKRNHTLLHGAKPRRCNPRPHTNADHSKPESGTNDKSSEAPNRILRRLTRTCAVLQTQSSVKK
ncbi:predicted protein [Nematostella vectensis]|uniref:CCHC-type domain-containing protein n=1 Tax=Nematostella vectensis TaxID=45351 RepID=A7SAP8_NEMVE|nr:predicted protein [Nematostella vectensis]|eukprot:XP_001631295.1 predicted protein [Nematostella vectensis]